MREIWMGKKKEGRKQFKQTWSTVAYSTQKNNNNKYDI